MSRYLQDRIDSRSPYQLLAEEVVPLYYNQDNQGVPHRWVQMMKASVKTNAPLFNTHRMIIDYVSQVYVPEIAARFEPILAKVY